MSLAVVAALARLFVLLGVGWGLRRWRSLGPSVPEALTLVVTELTMPAFIVATLARRPWEPAMFGAVLASLAGLLAALLVASLLAPRLTPAGPDRGTFVLAATFSNTGFLGIPVALALWGEASEGLVTAVMVDSFTTTLLLNTVGVMIAQRHGRGAPFDRGAVLRLLTTPMFLAAVLGLGLQIGGVRLPEALVTGLAELGAATVPLVFLATGMRLRFSSIPRFLPALGAIGVVRYGVAPLAALGVGVALGLDGELGRQAVLEVAMPTALLAPVVAARYGGPSDLGPAAVAATTAFTPLALLGWLALTAAAGM